MRTNNKPAYAFLLTLFFTQLVLLAQNDYYTSTLENFRDVAKFNEPVDLKNPDLARINAVIFYLTNLEREKQHLGILKYQPLLEKSASLHSENMFKQDFFDHINHKSKRYREPEDRARYVGIANPFIAENIAQTFVLQYKPNTPVYTEGKGVFKVNPKDQPIPPHTYLSLGESLLNDWMDSPGHRKNILFKDTIELGCGTYYFLDEKFNEMPSIMATQNFQLYEPVK